MIIIEWPGPGAPPGDAIDGSNDLLRPEDRVTEDDLRSPYAGLLRRVLDARRAAEEPAGAGSSPVQE